MRWWFLLLVSAGLLMGADAPPKGPNPPDTQSREIVGYVADVRNPYTIVLTRRMGVKVDKQTKYVMGTGKDQKNVTRADVLVGQQVRITVGSNGIATKVTIVGPTRAVKPIR